jgi:hypothetical protein
MRKPNLRILAVAALVLFYSGQMSAQQQAQPAKINQFAPCSDQTHGTPEFYYDAVVDHFKPPDFVYEHAIIKISVGQEQRLILLTDGYTFHLWMGRPDVPQENVYQFLDDLYASCRLPADPDDAAKLIKVIWESKELSQTQFTKLHEGFTSALSKYVSTLQHRYPALVATPTYTIALDATTHPIVYDNTNEHIEIKAPMLADHPIPITDWIKELQKLAEDSFHHPIWQR